MRISLAVIAVALATTSPINSAPFCAVYGYGTNCWYYDMNDCRRDAVSSSGACIVNEDEIRRPSGSAPFCAVFSFGTQCWYYDFQDCVRDARSSGGTCIINRR